MSLVNGKIFQLKTIKNMLAFRQACEVIKCKNVDILSRIRLVEAVLYSLRDRGVVSIDVPINCRTQH
jgi:hypothetical protein